MEAIRHADRAGFAFTNYLTRAQQAAFRQLSPSLQDRIQQRLLGSSLIEDANRAQRILDIFRLVADQQLHPTIERFFLTLLNADDDRPVPQVLDFVRAGHGVAFFQFASTRRREYYDVEAIGDIVATFQDCLNHPLLLPMLPRYDEGGRDYVLNRGHVEHHSQAVSSSSRDAVLDSNVYFVNIRSIAIRYLSSLPSAQRLPFEKYVKFFKRLQSDFTLPFKEYEKVALLKLILMTTSHPTQALPQEYTEEDLSELLDRAVEVHNLCGEELLRHFCRAPDLRGGQPLYDAIRALQLLSALSDNRSIFDDVQPFATGNCSLIQLLEGLENRIAAVPFEPTISAAELQQFMERLRGNDPNVSFPLGQDELQRIGQQFERVQLYCHEWCTLTMRQLVQQAFEIRTRFMQNQAEEEDVLRLIAIGRLALRLKFNRYPYPTQVLTILGILGNPRGRLAQVKTGEGKSIIVALHAFVLAMQGRAVDIISSSPNLSIRDQGHFKEFFKSFAIATSHICARERLPHHFRAQILYGTATDFEFAIMEEKLFFKTLFSQRERNFDCVIVDEIDNLTIDTLLNGARLGYPAEVSYDWVYLPILQFLQTAPDFARNLATLREYLASYMQGRFSQEVPKLSDTQLTRWISSGIMALKLSENKDYIIRERVDDEGKRRREVLIVDADNTGRIQVGSRWSNGLHEMVEAKHEIEIQKESLTPISFSHVNFYNLYQRIDGLTGTLGSLEERTEIREIYGIESFDVPTYRPLQRRDLPPFIHSTDRDYFEGIRGSVTRMRQRRRPILILCETIHDSQVIAQILTDAQIPFQMLNETQEEDEGTILERAGEPGRVTIATNTAGRGTDIILRGESRQRGGLHVLLTFYPKSKRVEDQARGRAGRQGEPGSSEIILSEERLAVDNIAALELFRHRETQRMRQRHTHRAAIERFCFPLTNGFFALFGQFHALIENEQFLIRNAELLSRKSIADPSKLAVITDLHPKDRLLREELLKLLTTKGANSVLWKALLKQLGERILDKMLLHWSLAYCKRIEEELGELQEQNIDSVRTAIRALYETNQQLWNTYLDPSGAGIALFIRDLTGLDLSKFIRRQ